MTNLPRIFSLALLAAIICMLGCGLASCSASPSPTDAASDVADEPPDAGPDAFDAGADPGDEVTADTDIDAADSGDPGATDGADGEGADGGDTTPDAGPDGGADTDCGSGADFDYHCQMNQPETCPGGMCLFGMCIGPVRDPDRWSECGDGSCGPCESAQSCPADCGAPPTTSGRKEYHNATTITVWLHGFYNKSPEEMADMVYGEFGSCGGILGRFSALGINRPCGNAAPGDTAPNQLVKVEYYGGRPAAWLSPTDVAEIEALPYDGPDSLERYARIAAKAIRHKLALSGATHVNIACHSFGCLITRYLIEHDLESLASENRLVRWFSSAGVIAGARLARLYDNPTVRETADLIGLELSDFVVMHPDFVADRVCAWDHRLYQGNHPLLAGMIIHHATATDPRIQEALNITLLDLNNPGDEPNDGIMFTDDERFHSVAPEVALPTPSGTRLSPSATCLYLDHMHLPEDDGTAALATAALFHQRRVIITLASLELLSDRESHAIGDGEHGTPPAEIAAAVEVRFNPYLRDRFGIDRAVHQTRVEHRSVEYFEQSQGSTLQPGYVLFAGPVFDEMNELDLDFELLELDWYPRGNVREWSFDAHQALYRFQESVPLQNAVISRENAYVRLAVRVEVVDQY